MFTSNELLIMSIVIVLIFLTEEINTFCMCPIVGFDKMFESLDLFEESI